MRRAAALAASVVLLSRPIPGIAQSAASERPMTPVALASSSDVLAEVRVHGNYATPDEVVLRIAGLEVGQAIGPGTVAEVTARLEKSGRFADVEVRRRSRSLSGVGEATIVVIVTEYAAAGTDDPDLTGPPSLGRRLASSVMFLPLLDYADGYGFTYGGRVTFAGALGRSGRLSVPLSWGGTKRAAAELEWPIGARHGAASEPALRLNVSGGWSSRENPHYDVDEDRAEVDAGVSREIVKGVRAAVRVGVADLTFAGEKDRLVGYGVELTIDTRGDPSFPRNAVLALASWEGTDARDAGRFNRHRLEGHGYLGLFGKSVLAVGARYDGADRALPAYAQPLLGGAETLRGFRPGRFASDNRFSASAELRVPFTSPLSVGTTGFALFADAGASYPYGTALRDADVERGVGGGLFVILPVGSARVDVAHGLGGGTRAHVTFGVRF